MNDIETLTIENQAAKLIAAGHYRKAMQAIAQGPGDLMLLAVLAVAVELDAIGKDMLNAGRGV